MKCQVVINSREKLANIIDSFHYAKSTYNWPSGSLPPQRANVESSGFSAVEKILFLRCALGFLGRPLRQTLPPHVLLSVHLHANLEMKNKVEGLMMKIAQSILNWCLFMCTHFKGAFLFCFFHYLTCCVPLTPQKNYNEPPHKSESTRGKIIGI